MSRLLTGIGLGIAAATVALGLVWWTGIVSIDVAGPEDEHAGHDMATMETEPVEDEHAGHDMAAMEAEPVEDEHAGHDMAAMETEPVEGEHSGDDMAAVDVAAAPADMPASAVMISPERQQLIGVRTAPVVREAIRRTIRTVGRVEHDETRVSHVHTRVSGWIQTLYVDYTGKPVQKGQPLIGIYSPELVSTQEEYLLALRAQDSLGNSEFPEIATTTQSLLESTRRRLRLWEISDDQIARLDETRQPQTELTIHAPASGYVMHKNAYEGQHVVPGTELYTIADLSEVWLIADIYESELPYVSEGARATVTLSYLPERTFHGVVDYVYPSLEGETRTAKVRIVLPNPGTELKPAMFANVEITANLGRSLVVPEDAVIDTGARQVVFLVLEGGHFLPREVVVGTRFEGKLQILSGLDEGDVVAAGAAFLIDSESKLGSALRGMSGHQH